MINHRTFASFFLCALLLLAACGEDKNQQEQNAEKRVNSQTNFTTQQIFDASLEGKTDLIKEAVKQDVDITVSDQSGRTPLMLASFNGHTEVVKLLLANGADPRTTDNEGQTALIFAASGPYPQTVEVLLKNGADPNYKDINEGWSPLMWAASEGNEQVVSVLLDHGADPNLRDNDDETARNFAEANGHQKVAELLKEAEDSQ